MPLTDDWKGTSHNPMFWNGRVYFLSDRDGVMNIFSMEKDGHDVKQLTHHRGWDVQSASISDGRIVYQCGADLWLLDLNTASGCDHSHHAGFRFRSVARSLGEEAAGISDRRAYRSGWQRRSIYGAREVFTLPATTGRIVTVAGKPGIRYREARYMPDGKSIIALSTETGETEFWKYPANGEGAAEQWTNDAKVLRWEGIPSPDGALAGLSG